MALNFDGLARRLRATAATIVAAASLVPLAPMAHAQDTVVVSRRGERLSRVSATAAWAVDVFNTPGTLQIIGNGTIEGSQTVAADVAVLNGSLVVSGRVTGDLVALNADVRLLGGALIEGNVVVLGGALDIAAEAEVLGTSRRHSERVALRLVGSRLELVERGPYQPPRIRPQRRRLDDSRASASLVLGLGETYNRVEGLPIRLGAKIDWRGGAMTGRIRGLGVFRTAGDFDGSREDLGYEADAELGVGRSSRLVVGGRAYDLVVPTQDWPLSLHEVGWASLLWHRDYRDYLLRRGVAAFLRLEPARGLALQGEVARVEEQSIAERDPWTPFRNAEPWRPNPLIDDGDFTLVTGTIDYDSRPPARSRGSGWLLRASWEHGVGENLVERPLPLSVRAPLPADDYTFDRVAVDLRRYQRVGWGGQLRLRGFWTGPVGNGDPLPVQRRVSLGGPDPLNGWGFRAFACNAGIVDPALTGLCDHVLLFQAEYRGNLGFDWIGFDHRARAARPARLARREEGSRGGGWDWDDWFWFEGPTLVLFSNAGTAWLDGQDAGPLQWDVGAGIEFGNVGLYLARAIEKGEPLRVTLRIERRF